MSVRAKFTFTGYEAIMSSRPGLKADGSTDWEHTTPMELRTLKFTPVYHNNDPDHENRQFWQATPSGEIRLGTVSPEAWSQFTYGKAYYIDFSEAPE